MAELSGSYSQHLDEDELSLDQRIATARENETRSSLQDGSLGDGNGAEAGEETSTASPLLGKRACLFIHPGKSFSMAWGFLTVLVVLWVTLSLPYKLAFLSER